MSRRVRDSTEPLADKTAAAAPGARQPGAARVAGLIGAVGAVSGAAGWLSLALGTRRWAAALLIAFGAVALPAAGLLIDWAARRGRFAVSTFWRTAAGGALVLGGGAAMSGLLASWRPVTSAAVTAALVMAGAAGVGAARRPAWQVTATSTWRVTPAEAAGLGGVALITVVGAAWIITAPLTLGHDESVYALQARTWLTAEPTSSVAAHRAPLLSVLLVPIVAFTSAEPALRSVGMASGLLGLAAVWTLGRVVFGQVPAWIGAAAFALAPTVLDAGGYALTDLPAAALLILAAAVCWWQFELRASADRGLLWLAPLAAGALSLRYGSALPLALLAVAVVVVWPAKAWSARARILQTAALLLVLWIPEGVRATLQFGTPWGRILYTSRAARSPEIGAGLTEYAELLPSQLAGPLVAALLAVGAAAGFAAIAGWLLSRPLAGSRAWGFLLPAAMGQIVLMGINSLADPRLVLFAIGLGCAAGAGAVGSLLRVVESSAGPATAAACLAALATSLLLFGAASAGAVGAERRERDRGAAVREAAVILAEQDRPCTVMTTFIPQMEWYSGCQAVGFADDPPADQFARLPGEERFLFFYGEGKRQPPPEQRLAFTELPGVVLITEIDGVDGLASLYRLPGAGEPVSDRS